MSNADDPPTGAWPPPEGGGAPEPEGATRAHTAVAESPGREERPPRVKRLWASRRVPTALAALVVLGASGFLLTVVLITRTGGDPLPDAQHWTSTALRERTWDDTAVMLACGGLILLGLILLLCGFIRGRGAMLPLRRRDVLIAYIHRRAVESMITDTAEHVRGVGAVNVNVRSRGVLVLASARYRNVDDVERELDAELGGRLERVQLDRPLRLTVRMDRERRRVR